ncbi:MAG TPA: aspartate:alanine exchanger family transporter [Anaerolineales bacterium]|nr:aspartate:alanine exchanger family transporter [Anaerolineales bacterium]
MNPFTEEMFVLFAILTLGAWLGHWSWRGISLGTAGVLFAALVFGHFGLGVPKAVMDLGLLLFVYSVGLSAGPSFFRTFRKRGMQFVVLALVVAGTGAVVTVLLAYLLHLPLALATGLYAGSLTCTPALAAATDMFGRVLPEAAPLASVGYGITYPFSMIGIVLLIQFLPRLLKRSVKTEEKLWLAEKDMETPGLQARQFRVTNANINGRTVAELNPRRLAKVNISRIKHGENVSAAMPESPIHTGDLVMAVGPEEELDKLRILLGEETNERMDVNAGVLSVDVEVMDESLTGKTLAQMRVWEQFTLVITRIRRQGLEIVPHANVALERGDGIRVVGEKRAVEAFVRRAQGSPRKAMETSMVPYLIGLLAGVLIGLVPVPMGQGITLKLGMAGGVFITSLLIGHFGKFGPFQLYVPPAAKNLTRELGLMLFLAGAGTNAGAHLVEVLQDQGWILLLAGAAVTTLSALAGLVVMMKVYRLGLLSAMGALTAAMTNPPALAAASSQTETDLPALYYASTYPVALIFKILLAQALVEILRRLL